MSAFLPGLFPIEQMGGGGGGGGSLQPQCRFHLLFDQPGSTYGVNL